MRLLAMAGIAVWLFACPRKPGPADASVASPRGPIDWQTFSSDGVAILTSSGDGKSCVVTCEGRGGKLMWERQECIAGRNDLRFVSQECEAVLVLKDAPQLKESVEASPVGSVWLPQNGETFVRLHQVANADGGVKLSDSGKWFGWLAGTLEFEGKAPRYDTSGKAVQFETLDGVHHELKFETLSRWVDRMPEVAAVVAPPPSSEPTPQVFFRWTNDEGVEQMGTEDQIPPKFRKRAKPIQAELAVVRAEPTDAGSSDAGEDAGVRDAGLPPPVNQCTLWSEKLSAIERELAQLQPPEECALEAVRLQNGMAPFGAEERAKCRATRDERVKAYETKKAKLEGDKAEAQERLRKAQVGGC